MNMQNFSKAEHLWQDVLDPAYTWEIRNPGKRIHKGFPYYYFGITSILKGDLDKGFLLIHQAFEEDKITCGSTIPQTPAYFFVTLDYTKQDQLFLPKVLVIAKFIEEKLGAYRLSGKGNLSMSDFNSKFQMEASLQESVFYFVYTMFRIRKLIEETDQKLTQNVFSSVLQANIIFDLCLIVDATIKNKATITYKPRDKWMFYDLLLELSTRASLFLDKDKLVQISQNFRKDFSKTLQDLLSSNYTFKDGTAPQQREVDLAITYGFRNFGAHKIENQPVIYNNFREIFQRILCALFLSVEKLY